MGSLQETIHRRINMVTSTIPQTSGRFTYSQGALPSPRTNKRTPIAGWTTKSAGVAYLRQGSQPSDLGVTSG